MYSHITKYRSFPRKKYNNRLVAYMYPDIPWYNNLSTLETKPDNFEKFCIYGIQDYLFMTSMLFMVRISNKIFGGKEIMFVNHLTEPYINLSKRLCKIRHPILQLSLAGMLVSTLFYSSCVYGYESKNK